MINETTEPVTIINEMTNTISITNAATSYITVNMWINSVLPWQLTSPWTYDTPLSINTIVLTNLS